MDKNSDKYIRDVDAEIADIIVEEYRRQNRQIELIASENFTSRAVMAAMGSVLTNKYAEGYPAKRYYGGCEVVDKAENLARDRAKQIFGCDHVNVQPHAGSQANMAVYFSQLQPGDTILAMNLTDGGTFWSNFMAAARRDERRILSCNSAFSAIPCCFSTMCTTPSSRRLFRKSSYSL